MSAVIRLNAFGQFFCQVVDVFVQHYSRGNIFPLSTCLCLAFSGPPSAFFACRALRRSMASFSARAFCLNSGDDTSTLLRMMETCSAWKECVWVAMHRLSWNGFLPVHTRFEAWTINLSSGGERSDDAIIEVGKVATRLISCTALSKRGR